MDYICDICGFDIQSLSVKYGQGFFEDRINVYGTYCPKCNSFIPSTKTPAFVIEYENKIKALRIEFIKMLGKHFKNKKG